MGDEIEQCAYTETVEQINKTTYTVYLDSHISEPSAYRDVTDILINAVEGDTIEFIINSPGGDLHTAIQLVALMEQTQAETVGILHDASSAAAVIFMACDVKQLHPYSGLMFHDFSMGVDEKSVNVSGSRRNYEHVYNKMLDKYTKGMLTDEERKELHCGKDMYIYSEEIAERLNGSLEEKEIKKKPKAKAKKKAPKMTKCKPPKAEKVVK